MHAYCYNSIKNVYIALINICVYSSIAFDPQNDMNF